MPRSLIHRNFRRILLVKPSALGDVINTAPVLVKLRRRYPDARIDWFLNAHLADWMAHHPALSGVVRFDRHAFEHAGRSWTATRSLARLLGQMRQAHYDLVIDLHGQFRSAFFTLATGAGTRVGFDRPRRVAAEERRLPDSAYRHGWTGAREGAWLAYTHRIAMPSLDIHAVERYLQVGALLGFDDAPPDMRVPVPTAARRRVLQLLRAHHCAQRSIVLLFPGTQWTTKHWSTEGFAEVARHLARKRFAVVLAGSPKERPICQTVAAKCSEAIDLSGETNAAELAALVEQSALCVTNDSGPMHLAVALDRPVVSVFGPTDPVWIGPYRRPEAVVRREMECAPCYLRSLSACRHDHRCMKEVTPADVIARVEHVLRIGWRESA